MLADETTAMSSATGNDSIGPLQALTLLGRLFELYLADAGE